MKKLASVNPATNEEIAQYEQHTDSQVDLLLDQANATFARYRNTKMEDRAALLQRCADLLLDRKHAYARRCTEEMGKPLQSAIAEIEKCAWVCRYYAENGAALLADEAVQTDATSSYISYQPLGVVLGIMPWNYPFWQVFRYVAPTLMAGNTCLLKHASNVSGTALAIHEVISDAGFDPGCFATLLVASHRIDALIADDRIAAVTLTGSGPAGRAVGSAASKAIKPSVLELGGSDPYLILADADLNHAAQQCATSRLLNNGQSCIGAKRFIVVEEVYDQWLELFQAKLSEAVMGDPMKPETTLGPLARVDLRDEVHQQVQESLAAGAKLTLGGQLPDKPGAYYPPTILTEVQPGMPAYDDEIFGPVASVIKVSDEAQAIQVANATRFGLGAAVFTQDVDRGNQIARDHLDAGCCFVNAFVKSDPRLPFGGIKESGYGRELSGLGIKAFVNTKTVYVA